MGRCQCAGAVAGPACPVFASARSRGWQSRRVSGYRPAQAEKDAAVLGVAQAIGGLQPLPTKGLRHRHCQPTPLNLSIFQIRYEPEPCVIR